MVSQIICFSVFASVVKQTGEMTLTVNFFEILWDGSEIIQESKKIGAGFQPATTAAQKRGGPVGLLSIT